MCDFRGSSRNGGKKKGKGENRANVLGLELSPLPLLICLRARVAGGLTNFSEGREPAKEVGKRDAKFAISRNSQLLQRLIEINVDFFYWDESFGAPWEEDSQIQRERHFSHLDSFDCSEPTLKISHFPSPSF